jgi:esterase/lipase superfamily enzyme
MSKRSLTGLASLISSIATVALALTALPTPAAQEVAAARGRVIDAARAPVSGAAVTAFADDGTVVGDATTSSDGSFEIRAPKGSYRLRVSVDRAPAADARVPVPSNDLVTIAIDEFTADPIPPPAETRGSDTGEPAAQEIRVFYATDRERSPVRSSLGYAYLPVRSSSGDLSFGSCLVSVARDKRVGQLEAASLWRLDFRNTGGATLSRVTLQDETSFFHDVSARAAAGNRKVLVFVHGFNTSFRDACLRVGQLTYDLGFSGAPVVYTWPSREAVGQYASDEETIQWTMPHLRAFLEKLASQTATPLFIIAHSMGSRALIQALSQPLPRQTTIRDIVFAAPDVDSGVFSQFAAGSRPRGQRVTLYASSRDRALEASRTFHDFARAGESGDRLLDLPGVDTIDASTVQTDFLGHSYFGDSGTVLRDLFELVRFNAGPDDRFALTKIVDPKRRQP